ncbi:aspartic proteinase NANA, chloroplast [Mercurialis annua]|uniref:aspartic proteinase NANA, chloroplast n=1 Tax=Mercurialis annua TaxID=3986 RepID=UPI00215FC1A9|nr:aspartic proteinase NANA, chloroplast [Mercurialis annua]
MSGPNNFVQLLLLISCCNVAVLFFQADATFEFENDSFNNDNNNHTGVWFEMLHRHSPKLKSESEFLGPPKSRLDGMSQLFHSDMARRQMIASLRQGKRRKAFEVSQTAQIPLRSGADSGLGQYFVSIRIGTPRPQKFILITDTGSDLTWMNCEYLCKDCPKPNPHPGRVFRAKDSSSFRTIPCSSDDCKIELQDYFSLTECPTPNAPCKFDYRYLNGPNAVGVFANETVTVGLHSHMKVRLFDVLIGCTESYSEGSGFPDGVMGLGYRKHSLALRLAEIFGNKFSYCLVDHLSSSKHKNFLSFGDVPEMKMPKMQYTELLLGYLNAFYPVNVSGISVGGSMLNISSEIWNVTGEGGMIIDSGTSLTLLAGEAYDRVVDALKPVIARYTKVVPPELPDLNDLCFEDEEFDKATIPRLLIHFADGAIFKPPVKSYIIDVAPGIKCVGIARADFPGSSILGNIMQQNHFWEYDLGRGKLGFGPSSCVTSDSNSKQH